MDPEEIVIGDWIIRLDDNVLELLHISGVAHRFHVNHVAVEAKPKNGGGLRLRVGVESGGEIVQGGTIDIPDELVDDVTDLFGEAKSRREDLLD